MSIRYLPLWEKIPDFDMNNSYADQWDAWYDEYFKKLELVADFEELSDAKKVSLLLLKLANFSAEVLEVDENTVEYAELVSKLRKHCSPDNLRQLFFKRRQHTGESFAEFAKCLEDLSRPCRFKEMKDSLVLNIFLLNMHEEYAEINAILRFQTGPITLQKTIMLANALFLDFPKLPGFKMDSLKGVIIAYNDTHSYGSVLPIEKEPAYCFGHKSAQPPIGEGLENNLTAASKPKFPAFSVEAVIDTFDKMDKAAEININAPTPSVRHDKHNDITPQLPIQFNHYAQVLVFDRPSKEKLYVYTGSDMNEIKDHISSVVQWFSDPENQQVLKNCEIGAACASQFNGSWYRAKIVSKDSQDNGVVIRYSDFGSEEFVSDLTKLMALPQEFADWPAFIFSNKIPWSVTSEEGDLLGIMPLHAEVWSVSVNRASDEVLSAKGVPDGPPSPSIQASSPTCHPNLRQSEETLRDISGTEFKASFPTKTTFSGRVADAGQPEPTNDTAPVRPPPPFPENTFTVVRVVYNGPEGVFAIEAEKFDAFMQMLDKIGELEHLPLQTAPVVGDVYIAPFDGHFYRARVLSIDQPTCHVTFVDFGSEIDLPIDQLRDILPEHASNFLTFKVSDNIAPEGTYLKVKPIFQEYSGSWAIVVEDELTYDVGNNLNRLDNVPSTPEPAPSPPSPPIPPNSFSNVRVACLAGPIDKLEILQDIIHKISQVSDIFIAPDGITLNVKTVFQEEIGSWTIVVEGELTSDVGNNLNRSGNVPSTPEPAPSSPSPPIPPNTFSNESVFYVGTEGTFVLPVDRMESLENITLQITQLEHLPLRIPPVVGEVCVAPFGGCFYWARVLSIDQQTCHIAFVDFGSETDLPIDQLREIPSEVRQ